MRTFSFEYSTWGNLSATAQAGRELPVDVDQAAQPLRCRIAADIQRMIHHEDADIGDVLTHLCRQRIVVVRGRCKKHRPELAIEQQRVIERAALAFPIVVDQLQS